jgi:hypothetical protein
MSVDGFFTFLLKISPPGHRFQLVKKYMQCTVKEYNIKPFNQAHGRPY